MKINLNVDRYVKVWIRDTVEVEAENKEEALKKMVKLIYYGDPDVGYTDGAKLIESRMLDGSEEVISSDETEGNVVEIEDEEGNPLWGNYSEGINILKTEDYDKE